MVQFARSRREMKDYAVKFFLDTDAFEAEATLYAAHVPALRASLAWTLAARAAAIAADAVTAAAVPHSGGSTAAALAAQPPRPGAAEQFLPEVVAVSDGTVSALEGPQGCGLPPFVVTTRGESLLEWSNRAAPDIFAALSVRLPFFPPHSTASNRAPNHQRPCVPPAAPPAAPPQRFRQSNIF